MQQFTDSQVAQALSTFGNFRTKRVQTVANEGAPDGISGALILALGLRETRLRNIEGGAKWDEAQQKWIALDPNDPDDAVRMDVGWGQINRYYHKAALQKMGRAVRAGTWEPITTSHTPYDVGYVPVFEDALQFIIKELKDASLYGRDHGVAQEDRARYAVAAHNAGKGGALVGYKAGNVDQETAGGDYSAWTLEARTQINSWLGKHDNWRVDA